MQKIYLTIGKPKTEESLKKWNRTLRGRVHKNNFFGGKKVFVPDYATKDKREFERFILGQIGSSNTVVIKEYIRKRNSNGKMQPTPHKIAKIVYSSNGAPHWEYDQLTNKEWFTGKPRNSPKDGYSVVFDE